MHTKVFVGPGRGSQWLLDESRIGRSDRAIRTILGIYAQITKYAMGPQTVDGRAAAWTPLESLWGRAITPVQA